MLLVNEAVLAVFNTVDDRKLTYLRRAVARVLKATGIEQHEAVLLSRLVRDLSAEEVRFMLDHETNGRLWFNEMTPVEKVAFQVSPSSPDGLVVNGLVSLGLLMPAEPTWDESGMLRWAPIVPKLMALLREDS